MFLDKLSSFFGPARPPEDMGVAPEAAEPGSDEEKAREALRGVIDPEVGLNIVDLGLVYGLAIDESRVVVSMTMTTPACPMAGLIEAHAEDAVAAALPGRGVEVHMVWDPPWGPDKMSPSARQMLGLF